ncbi:MAG: selenocysteine-specific translation elongation factor [Acidimicrobiales bacterium]
MSTSVIATAGHVDHGKSTLVSGLTGMDPDRLSEEKARGLTIDLGFAWTKLPSGREVAFVDVPGHVRFLKNMLAGVGAVDACLFVVGAPEGWKPQSEEHLRILELLGISHGVVALTKVASLHVDSLELAHLDLIERLSGTFLENAPVVDVDVPAGVGLEQLARCLDSVTSGLTEPVDRARPRLWIDRSFVIRGSGTVVTGTLAGGHIEVGARLELVPGPTPGRHPVTVRVRGLQSHLRGRKSVGRGRVAVNVSGVSYEQVERGQALVAPGQWEPTVLVDASLTVLASLNHEVTRRGAYRAYFGSGQHAVKFRLLGVDELMPGETGTVRLHLPVPLALIPGDRYVLREAGRSETVGGGEVFDVAPILPASKAHPDRSVDRVIAERGIIEASLLERLTGEHWAPDLGERWVTDPKARAKAEARLISAVGEAGLLGLDLARLSDIDRAILAELEGISVRDGRARVSRGAGGTDPGDGLDGHPYLDALLACLFRPPSPEEAAVDRRELRELVRSGRIIESDGSYFAAEAMNRAAEEIAVLLAAKPGGVTVSEIREALGTTRKYLMPLLAHLDGAGVTRRRVDLRIAGPLLPTVGQGAPRP